MNLLRRQRRLPREAKQHPPWQGEHFLITRDAPARYRAMSFGFEIGTFESGEDALLMVLTDYEKRIRHLSHTREWLVVEK